MFTRWVVGHHGGVSDPTPVKRAKHLMDPANPQRQVNDHKLTQVQRWVVSVLAVTTILHLSVGLDVAAYFLDDQAVVSRVGLCVIAGLFGVVAVGIGRLVHQAPIATPWLLLGLTPGVVGVVLVLFA